MQSSRRASEACRYATAYRPAGPAMPKTPSRLLVLAADQRKRAALTPGQLDVMQERVLAAVRNPHLVRAGLVNRPRQFAPIGVVGDDERQLDTTLPRPGADSHPAWGEGGERIWHSPRP